MNESLQMVVVITMVGKRPLEANQDSCSPTIASDAPNFDPRIDKNSQSQREGSGSKLGCDQRTSFSKAQFSLDSKLT